MPESAEEHRYEQVHVAAGDTPAVAAKGNVKLVAQEPRQRHIPAAPEIDERLRFVR
jgi:hypothetical protein